MVEWNPVAGMQELTWTELRAGDDVVQKSDVNVGSYTRINNVQPYALSRSTKYYLVERKIAEPEVRGALVEIYREAEDGEPEESIEFFIRTRPKFSDGQYPDDEAWTDADNKRTLSWTDIEDRVKHYGHAMRTFTPTYKED